MDYKIIYINSVLQASFPLNFVENQKAEITPNLKFKFRLLDGDRNIYFEGLANRNDSFAPLDFFGSEYGCTDLQFFENGKFVSL